MSRLQVTVLAVSLLAALAYVVIQARSDAGSKPMSASAALEAETPAADGQLARRADAGAPRPELAEASPEPLAPGVPALPVNAPTTVTFGVILVAYQGAQDAPKDAVPKPAALARARALLAEAKSNFAAATAKGDPGSTVDAGRLPRGVLEPSVEYALFTLEPQGVCAEPIDTPRGYWIVKRLQ
jgi:parvulin-like peptidyl-prolyl isomerase